MNELRFLDNIRSETIRNVQLNMPFKENKIEGTPILKLALVKRFKILILFKNKKKVQKCVFFEPVPINQVSDTPSITPV